MSVNINIYKIEDYKNQIIDVGFFLILNKRTQFKHKNPIKIYYILTDKICSSHKRICFKQNTFYIPSSHIWAVLQ